MIKTVLIPALDPDETLAELVRDLEEAGFDKIIVVDDGSGEKSRRIFESVESPACTVIRHDFNLGKGAAIKTGISAAADRYGSGTGIIGADADAQPRLLGPALKESGSRYEYEMNFLQDASEVAGFRYVPIETVYENNNKGSHFRTVRDSARVYGRLLKFAASSVIGALTDYLLFLIALPVFTETYGTAGTFGILPAAVVAATVSARILSGGVNFLLNKFWSFESHGSAGGEILRYLALFLAIMCLSAAGVSLMSYVIPAALAKPVVDTALFFASYTAQKRWVFGGPKGERI